MLKYINLKDVQSVTISIEKESDKIDTTETILVTVGVIAGLLLIAVIIITLSWN